MDSSRRSAVVVLARLSGRVVGWGPVVVRECMRNNIWNWNVLSTSAEYLCAFLHSLSRKKGSIITLPGWKALHTSWCLVNEHHLLLSNLAGNYDDLSDSYTKEPLWLAFCFFVHWIIGGVGHVHCRLVWDLQIIFVAGQKCWWLAFCTWRGGGERGNNW